MDLKSEYYYRILGLRPGASLAEVKSAYRFLAKIYHPDKDPSPDSAAMYSEIRTAYEKLMNWDNSGGILTRTGASTNTSTGAKTSAGTSTGTKSSPKTGTSTGAGAKTSTAGNYGKTSPTITYHRETEADDKEKEKIRVKYIFSSLAIVAILAALMFFILKIIPKPMSIIIIAFILTLMLPFVLF